jgi:hypothetical protein
LYKSIKMAFIKEDTKSKRHAWKYKLIQAPITLTRDIKKVKLQKQLTNIFSYDKREIPTLSDNIMLFFLAPIYMHTTI